ncbi:MAG TPA: hypothetical protein VGR78_06605 [Verrucomicrobiae bacterium]|nr:hypothetical protein [Verrucomicrobiae bacterium]
MAGCRRQTGQTGQSDSQSAPAIRGGINNDSAQNEPDQARLNELTQAVRRFGAEQQRRPQSLQELVDKGYLSSIPAAPAGKKFVINKNLAVVLEVQ